MKQIALILGNICRPATVACSHASDRFILATLVLLVQFALAPMAPAATTLTWDINSGTTGAQDGAGTWDATTANWWNGSANVIWTNADANSAIFGAGGAGGTVSVGSGIVVANLTLNTNYIFSGNTLYLTNSGVITAALGTSNMIGSYFGGTVGWTLEGGGTVNHNISGNDTYTGTANIDNGVVWVGGNDARQYFTGDVLVGPNGLLRYTSGGSTGGILGGNKNVILNGGRVSGLNTSKYLPVNKVVVLNGGGIIQEGAGNYSITIATNFDLRDGLMGLANRYTQINSVKSTAGSIVITNLLYGTGMGLSNLTLNAGEVVLDKSFKKTEVRVVGPLFFAGGSLVNSNSTATAGAAENSITSTTVNPGASSVKSVTTGAAPANGAVALTAITRQTGGTLDAVTNGTGNAITTTTGNNNGILGGWATLNSADWAVGSPLVPYAAYITSTTPSGWATTDNVSVGTVSVGAFSADTMINSLRYTATPVSDIALGGNTLTLASGGLLVTGSAAPTISGGTLKGGSGADLIVQQYSTGDLTLSSTLADNGTASSLTKSGNGKLIISGANTMTGTNYLNAGIVEVSDLAKLAGGPIIMTGGTLRYTGADATESRAFTLNGAGGTFDVSSSSTTLTVTNNLGNSDGIQIVNATAGSLMGNMGGLTKIGSGKLVLGGINNFNGLTVVSNGTLLVNGTNNYDTSSFNAGKVSVAGGVLGGTGKIAGSVTVKNGGTVSPGASPGTLTVGGSFTFESGSANSFEVANSPGTSDQLVVQGDLSISNGCAITLSVIGDPLAVGTYTLIQYSGKKIGAFNTTPVLATGSINGSYTIDDSTAGQINLVVTPQVAITQQPAGTNIVDGQTFSVNVAATGTAPLAYQWFTNADATYTTMTPITGATSSSYSVASAQASDSGFYCVVVTNNYNSVTSIVVHVIVAVTAPVLSGPTNQTVIAGNNATLVSTLTAGAPAPTYQWYFGSTPLTDDGVHISGSTSLSLTITNVQYPADQGAYSIVASNVAGTFTNSATLTVIVPPVISPQPASQTVNQGDTANFVSGATGIPTPGLQWYKNNVGIPGQTSGTLTIANAQGSDVANYTLMATNAAGSVVSSIVRLTVVSTNLAVTAFAPANGATGVCYDTPLYVTFNGPVSILNTNKIRIYNANNPATPVDTIDMGSNMVFISTLNAGLGITLTNNIQAHSQFPGDSTPFNYFPVIISNTVAAIYPHGGVLTSNQTYFVTLDSGIVTDSGQAQFAGMLDTNAWRFTTKQGGPDNPTNLFVAADGSGDFATVQGALDSIPLNNNNYTLINIRDGNYVEIVNISGKSNVTLRGQSRLGTIVGYGNNFNLQAGGATASRMAFKVNANDIAIENLTLVNRTPQGGGQAETLMINTGAARCIVNNCDVNSLQDTILANVNSAQVYFNNSTIRGNFDYIWGGGNVFLTNCVIHTVSNIYVTNNYNLTASRTDVGTSSNATTHWPTPWDGKFTANGISYVNCKLEADPVVHMITFEGANGTQDGLASFVNCLVDTNHYVAPGANIMTNYILWEYGNSNLDGSAPVVLGLTNLTGPSDPRLLAAGSVTNWFYGWQPALAPNITGQPANASVSHGQSANFSVSATGIPDPSYQWLKNGSPISGQTGATLNIASAVRTDGGNYSVVVSTGSGSVTSLVATLTYNNTAPVANPSTYSHPAGFPLQIAITGDLSTYWSDADGDLPALSGSISSTNGASVNYDGSYVYYTNANDVADQIDYTIDDGFGGTTAGVISVVVTPPPTSSAAGAAVNNDGSVTLNFVGVPNYTYQVDAATTLSPPDWVTVSTNTADPYGMWQFIDLQATNYPQRFYRSVYRP